MSNDHHYFSPSTHYRAFACPASVLLSKAAPDTESPEASEGTRIHAILAVPTLGGLDTDAIKEGDAKHIVNATAFIAKACETSGLRGKWEAEKLLHFCIVLSVFMCQAHNAPILS